MARPCPRCTMRGLPARLLNPWWGASTCTNCYLLDRVDKGEVDEGHAAEIAKAIHKAHPELIKKTLRKSQGDHSHTTKSTSRTTRSGRQVLKNPAAANARK